MTEWAASVSLGQMFKLYSFLYSRIDTYTEKLSKEQNRSSNSSKSEATSWIHWLFFWGARYISLLSFFDRSGY